MPLRTETYDLDEEVQRLEDKLEEIDAVLDQADDDNPVAQQAAADRPQIEAQLEGVRWARDDAHDADYGPKWDEDVDTIELAGLTAGEFGRLEDDIGQSGGGNGMVRVHQVAKGTADAPYVDEGMDKDDQIIAVSQLPVSYTKWAEARIDELTGVGGNEETSYAELYEETQTSTQA